MNIFTFCIIVYLSEPNPIAILCTYLYSLLSQDIVERQKSDGHQQSRQSDASLSDGKESIERNENIVTTTKVCNIVQIF